MDMSMPMTSSSSSSPDPSAMSDMSMSMPMGMTFFTATDTPLFTSQFAPTTTGQYAGICIFLIFFSLIFRLLLALKSRLERHWHAKHLGRRYIISTSASQNERKHNADEDDDSGDEWDNTTLGKGKMMDGILTVRGVTQQVRVVQSVASGVTQPFRLSVDLMRAIFVTIIVGVAYLLMLAIMTMNVGYFLSVLGGAFLGELCFGRWTHTHLDEEH